MDFVDFDNIVEVLKSSKPKLFELDFDAKCSNSEIANIEKFFNVKFPKSYKIILENFGGGYFGHVVIFSGDKKSNFYLRNHVSLKLISEENIFPVIDLETGDYICFKIDNGICLDEMVLWNHDGSKCEDLNMGLYETVLKYGLDCF